MRRGEGLPAQHKVETAPSRAAKTREMWTWLRAMAYRGGGVPEQTLWYYRSDGSCVVWSAETGEVSTLPAREK